jgi:hypothetical protein
VPVERVIRKAVHDGVGSTEVQLELW